MLVFESRSLRTLISVGSLFLSASLVGQVQATPAAALPASPSAPPPTGQAYPQIVRVRTVEGDVRISRSTKKNKAPDEWEQAVDDVPLETGYSLVTGDGRAEIEFEDASTLYLDKNSALSFDDLHTTAGVPHTEISLLTGTATAHFHPVFPGEIYLVKTPTDRGRVAYPTKVYERFTSYLDALAITHLQEPDWTGKNQPAIAPVTVFHNNGKAVDPQGKNNPAAFTEWDAWVAERVTEHEEALKDVATMSGLLDSTPGLADMKDQGVFFPCAPYGTCWEPTAQEESQIAPPSPVGQGPEFRPKLSPAAVSIYAGNPVKTKVSTIALQGFTEPVGFTVEMPDGFTCVSACSGELVPGAPFLLQLASATDLSDGEYNARVTFSSGPLTHVSILKIYVGEENDAEFIPVDFGVDAGPAFPCGPGGYGPHLPARGPRGGGRYGGAPAYAWAVCHTGAWIYRRHMYVWVIDKRRHPERPEPPRHPHPPIVRIKYHHKEVWVPRHPDDVEGKAPVNGKYVAFRASGKNDGVSEIVKLDPKEEKPAVETAKEIDESPLLGLVVVEPPLLFAYETGERGGGGKMVGGTNLRFNRESHSFLLARSVTVGGKTRVVTESFDEHRATRPAGAGAVSAARAGGSSHGGGGGSHAASGGSHAAAGGSHTASAGGHTSTAPASSGSHASAPPPAPHH